MARAEIIHARSVFWKCCEHGLCSWLSCFVLSLCDPDAAVAPAWYSVGTAWQVVALSDMELGLPLKPKHTQVGSMGTWHYCPIRNLFIYTLSI